MKAKPWFDGTTCLAAVIERFAPGETLTITRKEVEAAKFGTKMPVMFTQVDADTIKLRVARPGDAMTIDLEKK